MALDPRIILGLRPLQSIGDMQDDRARREIANQEIELRRQDIDLRRQALQQRGIGQPKEWDPNKANQALKYQQDLGAAVYKRFVQAKQNPTAWSQIRRDIAQLAGPDAVADLPEAWDDQTAAIVDSHIASYPAEAEKAAAKMGVHVIGGRLVDDTGKVVYESPDKPGADIDLTKSSIDVQAADALRRGDMDAYKRLLKVKKEIGQADDRPPTTIRMTNGMTPGQAFTAERSLRNDFARETKSAQTVAQQLALMESSLAAVKQGKAAAGSQGVLVTFQKILDPTSVVRESEYARSASGLSLLGQIEGKWDQLRQGGAGVTAADLEQFVALARQFNRNQQAFAKQTKDQIDAAAKEYGLDPSRITKDVGAVDLGEPALAAPAAPGSAPKPPVNPFRKK